MGRRRQKPQFFENVEILDISSDGKSIAKIDDMVVFVSGAVPGDVVDLKTVKKKKSFMEAIPTAFHKYSEQRIDAICSHFGTCGGCKWQNLSYTDQLAYKQKQVDDQLSRIAKVDLPESLPILASEDTTYYRNKLEYTFMDTRWLTKEEIDSGDENLSRTGLGFHLPRMWNRVLHIDHCHLQQDPSNELRLKIYDFAQNAGYTFYNPVKHHGFLRNLIIRTAVTGDLMVIVQFGENNKEDINTLMAYIKETFPQITSLMYVVNTKQNDTFHDLEVKCYDGQPYIIEEMEGLKFRVGPKSFYQTNSKQAYELYKVARDFAGLTGEERVYDLYTGTGTIAQFVSKQAKEVIGIEYVESAIEDAKKNADLNEISHCKFFAGDMKDILTSSFIAEHGNPDVIITDPPRAGMHADVVKQILEVEPEKVVYVSCNPATQARDVQLMDAKYKVTKVRAVDMFPHTHHVESVVLLEKR